METAPVPEPPTPGSLREAARGCRACELWRSATQVVFGEGSETARLMLVGEQPGDREDLEGRPFVGPAGRVLDEALEAAGIDRKLVYVTNAVKHFKWLPRGKRRLHQRPNAQEIRACRPWLQAEVDVVRPGLIVCMGATAGQAVLGPGLKVTQHRGEILSSTLGPQVMPTVHPASIVRIQDGAERDAAMEAFTADLMTAARFVGR